MQIYLCGRAGRCTKLEIKNKKIILSNKEEKISIPKDEWNKLVHLIKEGKLGEI